jgi:hypothetical protein
MSVHKIGFAVISPRENVSRWIKIDRNLLNFLLNGDILGKPCRRIDLRRAINFQLVRN